MSNPQVSSVVARYIGKQSKDYERLKVYKISTWLMDGIISVTIDENTTPIGYSNVADFCGDWQVLRASEVQAIQAEEASNV